MTRSCRAFVALSLLMFSTVLLGACEDNEPDPIRIGVILTMSGEDHDDYLLPLEWARDNVNAAGGVAGRKIEFVYGDTAGICGNQVIATAEQFADDDDIVAVIGPEWSDQVLEAGQIFANDAKPMVSPEATADKISFDFSGTKYVWRTVESDMAQLKIQLYIAKEVYDASTVALITDNGPYGRTFRNWFDFFAVELGLETTALVLTDYSFCEADVDDAVVGQPDVLIAVPRVVSDAVCTIKTISHSSPDTRVIFADGARFPSLIEQLPSHVERLEGTAPTPDPTSGYAEAYEARFGSAPGAFSANIYDAVLLLAYGLERSQGEGRGALADAMREVVDGDGPEVGWDQDGIAEGLRLIREAPSADALPNISGASGPLEYNSEHYVDPQATWYVHWRVENGQFVVAGGPYTTGDASPNVDSVFDAAASDSRQSNLDGADIYVEPWADTWAVIVAASRYWKNYRHQADAMAQYAMLKKHGMPDERIILILEDDLADNEDNPLSGVVRNEIDGENLHSELEIDYKLSEVTPEAIMDILAGRAPELVDAGDSTTTRDSTPTVDSTATDNLYLFWVGHGATTGLSWDAMEDDQHTTLHVPPRLLADTVEEMAASQRFRRFLIVIETCHSGAMGEELERREIPSVLVLTGARRSETSKGCSKDPELGYIEVADKFAYEFWKVANDITEDAPYGPEDDLKTIYVHLYSQVLRSHVSAYNAAYFGDTSSIPLLEFLSQP